VLTAIENALMCVGVRSSLHSADSRGKGIATASDRGGGE
jgi:hypothetical protein